MPLARQVKDWERLGVTLSRGTLSSWVIKTTEEWLYPWLDVFEEKLKTQACLHADETPVQVLKESGRSPSSRSYMWVFSSGKHTDRPIRLFHYAPTRSGEVAADYLSGFHGYLVTDDFAGYNRLRDVRRCGCWAHVRRKFKEAMPSDDATHDSTFAARGLAYCNQLFELERRFERLDLAARYEARLEESRLVLDAFWEYVEEARGRILPKTKLGKALSYAKDNRDRLMTFLEDGCLEISNAVAENAIRPFAVGRKNWLFSGSPKGAKASACVYSLVETAKANHLDPYLYLKTLLEQCPNRPYRSDPTVMEDLMPWSEFIQNLCGLPR